MFERWLALYKEILKEIAKDIDGKTVDIFERLNKLLFAYEQLGFIEFQARVKNLNNVITLMDKLIENKHIMKLAEISSKVKSLRKSAVHEYTECLIHSEAEKISNAIKDNDIELARALLQSKIVKENLQRIAENLITSYFHFNLIFTPAAAILLINILHEIKFNFNFHIERDPLQRTPLIVLLEYNRNEVEILQALISAGADVNLSGSTCPLLQASYTLKVNFVRELLKSGANAKIVGAKLHGIIDRNIDNDETKGCQLAIIEMLIKAGAPTDIKDWRGNTLLRNAVCNGDYKLVDLLLTLGLLPYANMINDAISSESSIFGCNSLELVNLLIVKYKMALPETIPPNTKLELFQLCCLQGMTLENYTIKDIVVLKTPRAIRSCLLRGDAIDFVVERLPSSYYGVPYCAAEQVPFSHYAALYAAGESLAMLIAAGLNVHERSPIGATPLHYATISRHVDNVKILILAGADVNALDKNLQAPLHWAVENGMAMSVSHIPCARVLLYAGADKELKDNKGRDPLSCLYTGGCHPGDRIGPWNDTFRVSQRMIAKKIYTAQNLPTLFQMSVNALVSSARNTTNLTYRNQMTDEMAAKIEEAGKDQLSP